MYQTIPTRYGWRLEQHGTVLSEVRTSPGPTHSVADVIAAALLASCNPTTIALLGFAGGGLVAPLRAMGCQACVDAVDLDPSGWSLFQRGCREWAGKVRFTEAEAGEWLSRSKSLYEGMIEDLSVPVNGDVFKPEASWSDLPRRLYRRLHRDGVVVFNLLRPRTGTWKAACRQVVAAGYEVRRVDFVDYENRLLVVSRRLPRARELSSAIRTHLRSIKSCLAQQISVRQTLP